VNTFWPETRKNDSCEQLQKRVIMHKNEVF
jgi:hypothetical protein